MITLTITADTAGTNAFLVKIEGVLKNPRGLNAALGSRLADELQDHFRGRNAEPNKMGAPKTNYWQQVAEATKVESITDSAAIVAVAEQRFRIHLFGGTIKPTGGRKFLTIPLIKEARALRAREYESKTGHKLFRLPGSRVLVERDDKGDRSLMSGSTGTIRGRSGYRKINIGGRTRLRAVYALCASVTLKPDPKALPDKNQLITALMETGTAWIKTQEFK